MYGVASSSLDWSRVEGDDCEETPFHFVSLPDEETARKIATRAILVRGVLECWGIGDDAEGLKRAVAAYPEERKAAYLAEGTTFKVEVEDFGTKGGHSQLISRLEAYDIPFRGRANLKEPDHVFWSVVSDASKTANLVQPPKKVMFGRLIGRGDRAPVKTYELSKRVYLGPTSMDAEMALLMANMAHARPGGMVLDPFCGTGSMIIAAAHYGAMTMGFDIDIRVIKYGKHDMKDSKFGTRESDGTTLNVWSNFRQYGLQPPVALLHADLHALPMRAHGLEGTLQGIVADPPYGVRAGGRKSGSRKPRDADFKISEEHLDDHIPSTRPYLFGEMNDDLMELGARFLAIGGRMTFFMPGILADEDPIADLPTHPSLRLRWHSIEPFNAVWGRRLVTYEKVALYDPETSAKTRADAVAAREARDDPDLIDRVRELVYCQASAEDRKKARYKKFFGDKTKADVLAEHRRDA